MAAERWLESARDGEAPQDQCRARRLFGERQTVTERIVDRTVSEIYSAMNLPPRCGGRGLYATFARYARANRITSSETTTAIIISASIRRVYSQSTITDYMLTEARLKKQGRVTLASLC